MEGPISNQAGLRAFVSTDRKQLCVNNACPSLYTRTFAEADLFDCTTSDDNLQFAMRLYRDVGQFII